MVVSTKTRDDSFRTRLEDYEGTSAPTMAPYYFDSWWRSSSSSRNLEPLVASMPSGQWWWTTRSD